MQLNPDLLDNYHLRHLSKVNVSKLRVNGNPKKLGKPVLARNMVLEFRSPSLILFLVVHVSYIMFEFNFELQVFCT